MTFFIIFQNCDATIASSTQVTLPVQIFMTNRSVYDAQWPIRYIVGIFWGYSLGIMTSYLLGQCGILSYKNLFFLKLDKISQIIKEK